MALPVNIRCIARAEFSDDSQNKYNYKCKFSLTDGRTGICNLYDQNVNLFLNVVDSEKIINNSSVFKKKIDIDEEKMIKANEILARVFNALLKLGDAFHAGMGGQPTCHVDLRTGETHFWG